MGDHHDGVVFALKLVDTVGDDFHGIDIEARIGFVEDGDLWGEDGHLEDFVSLFFTTGIIDVDGTFDKLFLNVEKFHFFPEQLLKIKRVKLFDALMLANFVETGSQKDGVADTGDLDRILKSHEYSFTGALFRFKIEDIDLFEIDFIEDLTLSGLIIRMPRYNLKAVDNE